MKFIKIVIKVIFLSSTATGFLLGAIPRQRKYVCFLGHQGYFNGNAKYLFQKIESELGREFSEKNKKEFIFIYKRGESPKEKTKHFRCLKVDSRKNALKYAYYLWFSKVLIITTPGFDWRIRWLFAYKARTVLLSNGVPLKAPGILSKHFSELKKLKYISYWKDIDQIWVSSMLEKYVAASTLLIPIDKVRVIGAARQMVFQKELFFKEKLYARQRIQNVLGGKLEHKKLVLVALTQRAYLKGAKYNALTSFRKLNGFDCQKFIEFLERYDIHVVVRDHFLAQGQEDDDLGGTCSFMGAEIVPELNDVISGFDVIISDYSGLYLDLLDLNIPIGLLRYPGDEFIERRGLILPDSVLANTISIKSMKELFDLLLREEPSDSQRIAMGMLHSLFFEIPAEECMDKNVNSLIKLIES